MSDKYNNHDCVQGVGCSAVNCVYNDSGSKKCAAENIMVGGYDSTRKTDTFCSTFSEKK